MKKILFISVKFFEYERQIIEELEKNSAIIQYFDERPHNSSFVKALIRINKSFLSIVIKIYYKKILKEISQQEFDYFILIKGELIPSWFLVNLKLNNPRIKFIYYTFDSIKNNPNSKKILHYFDSKFSFDKQDSEEYKMNFLPLFYNRQFETISNYTEYKYDLLFIGTIHSDRYRISQEIKQWCEKNGFKCYFFYYYSNKYLLGVQKLFKKDFKEINLKNVSYKSLNQEEIITLFKDSRIILDIHHPNQTGLTMRTIETMGAKRKLITTNKNIKDYPFYNKNNISIVNRSNPMLENEFFTSEIDLSAFEVASSLSLERWVRQLFS